jgi:hypothetical protein
MLFTSSSTCLSIVKLMRLPRKTHMDTLHLKTYLHLIEALLQCAKGEEWLLLQQHEELIDAELIGVMVQVTEQLTAEENFSAAKFLHYWIDQLTHLLQQNTATETSAENRAQSYLKLIQTILGCVKGDEVAILSQHPDLVDVGLVYTMNQVAAQLAAKGNQDTAIYLKHFAAEVNRVLVHSETAQPPGSALLTNSYVKNPVSQVVPIATNGLEQVVNKLPQNERQSCTVGANNSPSKLSEHNHNHGSIDPAVEIAKKRLPDLVSKPTTAAHSNHLEELLENISSRLEKLETSINKHQNPANPLWYMSILEQADAQGWIVSSEEVEQLIGTKPHCAPDRNSFVRGCWKFEKAGKVGMHSSWRVTKEMINPSSLGVSLPLKIATVEPNGRFTPAADPHENQMLEPAITKLELDLSSPWSEQ